VVLALTLLIALFPASALAASDATHESLDRMQEVLTDRIADGRLNLDDVLPAIIVSTQPKYEESKEWFAVSAIQALQVALGEGSLRLCEACMVPRAFVEDGTLDYQSGTASLDEIAQLDEQTRGTAPAAKSAIWVDEHSAGVAVRIVDLRTGRVLLAQNLDPQLIEYTNSQRQYSLSEELARRARGDSLTQTFVDFAIYPGQHLSMDWTDQWGKKNDKLSGVTISFFDPIVGIGAAHYQHLQLGHVLVGGQLVVSLPTAMARALSDQNLSVLDPLVTAVGVVRVPFGRSNYGAVVMGSTNGELGVGISLMNITFLPVLL